MKNFFTPLEVFNSSPLFSNRLLYLDSYEYLNVCLTCRGMETVTPNIISIVGAVHMNMCSDNVYAILNLLAMEKFFRILILYFLTFLHFSFWLSHRHQTHDCHCGLSTHGLKSAGDWELQSFCSLKSLYLCHQAIYNIGLLILVINWAEWQQLTKKELFGLEVH